MHFYDIKTLKHLPITERKKKLKYHGQSFPLLYKSTRLKTKDKENKRKNHATFASILLKFFIR